MDQVLQSGRGDDPTSAKFGYYGYLNFLIAKRNLERYLEQNLIFSQHAIQVIILTMPPKIQKNFS